MLISRRELEVLNLIAYEYTSQEIAQLLFISAHTVLSHRKRMMYKLKVKNTAGLIRKGFEEGFLTVPADPSATEHNVYAAFAY